MRRRSARLATFFRSRTRQLVWAGSLAVLGVLLLAAAYETADFARDVLVNLGASVVMVGLTFVVFDPIFEDMRRNAVQEHRDLDHDQLVADIAAAQGAVDVLETWTGLLEDRHRDRFLTGWTPRSAAACSSGCCCSTRSRRRPSSARTSCTCPYRS